MGRPFATDAEEMHGEDLQVLGAPLQVLAVSLRLPMGLLVEVPAVRTFPGLVSPSIAMWGVVYWKATNRKFRKPCLL